MPGTYGIPAGFDFDNFDAREAAIKKLEVRIFHRTQIVGMLFGGVGAALISVLAYGNTITASIWAGFGGLFAGLVVGGFVGVSLMDNSKAFLKSRFTYYFAYKDKVSAYRADLAAWEFTNSESGLGYWEALRGTDFEKAVALLLRRRGCDVTMTKGSGDGGVDLVWNLGGKAYWCQCKAHAKPISVAPIREIAGVCSKGQAVAVVLAVNGYTKPALETAEELGVRCLGAGDLCRLARMETIVSIN
jgi:hypothetical protein